MVEIGHVVEHQKPGKPMILPGNSPLGSTPRLSGAVRIAVQECLQNHPEMHPAADRIARMRAIATRAADRIHATPGPDLQQVMNNLYDSDGLPTSTPITP